MKCLVLLVGLSVGASSARADQADPVIPADLQPALAELFSFQDPHPLAGLESLEVEIGPQRVRYSLRLPDRGPIQVEVVLRAGCPAGAEPQGGPFCLVEPGQPGSPAEVRQALLSRLVERSADLSAGLVQIRAAPSEPESGPDLLIPIMDLAGLVLLLGLVGLLLSRLPAVSILRDPPSTSGSAPIHRLVTWACLAVLGGLHAAAWSLWGSGSGSVEIAGSLWWQQLAMLMAAAGLEPIQVGTGLGVTAHGVLVWISCWAAWRSGAAGSRPCPWPCDLGAGLVLASSPWLAAACATHTPDLIAGGLVVASTVRLVHPTADGGRAHGLLLIAGLAFSPWVALVLLAHSLLGLAPWAGAARRDGLTWIRFGLLWVAAGALLGWQLMLAISTHAGPPWLAGTIGLHPNMLGSLWAAGLGWTLLVVAPWSVRPETWAGAARPWAVTWLAGLVGLVAGVTLSGGVPTAWMAGVSGVAAGACFGALAQRWRPAGWIGLGLIPAANLVTWILASV